MLTALHVTFIIATGALVAYSDEQGLMWILGKKETLPAKKVEWLHALVGVGLALIVATGGLLFLRNASFYIAQMDFLVKMVFVFALIVNGFFIQRFTSVATTHAWRDLSMRERLPMLISGAVSSGAWIGAAICGLLLG